MKIPKYIINLIRKAKNKLEEFEEIMAKINSWDQKVNAEKIECYTVNARNLSEAIQAHICHG